MPRKGDVHIVYRRDEERWAVEVEGQSRASGLRGTQREAIDLGRRVAERNRSELLIHRRNDGRIRQRDSHGHDPSPPRG